VCVCVCVCARARVLFTCILSCYTCVSLNWLRRLQLQVSAGGYLVLDYRAAQHFARLVEMVQVQGPLPLRPELRMRESQKRPAREAKETCYKRDLLHLARLLQMVKFKALSCFHKKKSRPFPAYLSRSALRSAITSAISVCRLHGFCPLRSAQVSRQKRGKRDLLHRQKKASLP